jgi:hypothetical protein
MNISGERRSLGESWARRRILHIRLEHLRADESMDDRAGEPPTGWVRICQRVEGVPVWKRQGQPCYVATHDMD